MVVYLDTSALVKLYAAEELRRAVSDLDEEWRGYDRLNDAAKGADLVVYGDESRAGREADR